MANLNIQDSTLLATIEAAIVARAATLASAEATRVSTEEAARVVAVKVFLNVVDGSATVEAAISSHNTARGYTGDTAARTRAMVLSRFGAPQPARSAEVFIGLLKQGYRG